MTIAKPVLSAKYAIHPLPDVDIDGIIAPMVRTSTKSPVFNMALVARQLSGWPDSADGVVVSA